MTTMLPHAHFFAGLIAAFLLKGSDSLLSATTLAFLLGNTILDADYLVSIVFPDKFKNHRDFVTHWPITYLLGGMFGALLSIDVVTWFCLGAMGHLILDTVDWGISWLRPITARKFSLLNLQANIDPHWTISNFLRYYYSQNIVIVLELVLMIFSIYLLLVGALF